MKKDVKEFADKLWQTFYDSPRNSIEIKFVPYLDELAEMIGCRPNLWKIALSDFKLWTKIFFGPGASYQYRLTGPFAWSGARDAILTAKDRVVGGMRSAVDCSPFYLPPLPPNHLPGKVAVNACAIENLANNNDHNSKESASRRKDKSRRFAAHHQEVKVPEIQKLVWMHGVFADKNHSDLSIFYHQSDRELHIPRRTALSFLSFSPC